MPKALAALLAIGFVIICGVVLLRQSAPAPANPTAPATTAPQPVAAPPAQSAPPTAGLTITIVSGFTKKTWLDLAVQAFNNTHETVDGQVVAVKAQYANSGDALRSIQDGSLKPEIWSPADASWYSQANDWWKGQNNRELFPQSTPLVNVPLVIAMWEPMAKAIGWPNPIGWSDLARISTDPQGWARYGHPEWGRFTWGHCHPDSANGFQTMVCMVYAITGKTAGLTVDDLRNPAVRAKLTELERSVEHYGLSSRWIDEFMRAKGPAYLSAAAQYENNVVEGNLASGNKPFPLVAIYPKEGTVFNENPAAIPEADWVTAAERGAAERFIAFLRSEPQQQAAVQKGLRPAGRSDAPGGPFSLANGVAEALPSFPVFEIPSPSILNRVRDLWFETKKPASVTLIIDTSGSMNGEPMLKAKEGAVGFLDQMYPQDEIEIIVFNSTISVLSEMDTVAKVREGARARLQGLFANGGTHLYDVADLALKRIATRRQRQPDRHYGLVLLTDGKDEGSTLKRQDLIDTLPKGDAPEVVKIFTIAYGEDLDKSVLKELSNRTNARMFESTTKNIAQVYAELVANF